MTTSLAPSLINSQFRSKLILTPVKHIAPAWSNIVVATSEDTIATVFLKLVEKKLFGLPLYDKDTMKYVAFIDMFDILAYVVQELNLPVQQSHDWAASQIFRTTSCMVLPGRSPRSTWNILGMDTPLQSAINQLCQSNRLALIDAHGTLCSVLSRSRVINFIANHVDWTVGTIFSQSVESLGLVRGPVVCVNQEEITIRAFLKMYQQDVSGVAVTNDRNELIGNISVSDLKDIGYTLTVFNTLYIPCRQFLHRKIEGMEVPLVYLMKSSPLSAVMEKFRVHQIRRVYIVESSSNLRPLGVITHTDVLELFSALSA